MSDKLKKIVASLDMLKIVRSDLLSLFCLFEELRS